MLPKGGSAPLKHRQVAVADVGKNHIAVFGAVDGKEVRSFDALKTALAYKKVGDTAVLTVYRITGQSYFGSRYDTYEVTVKIHEYTKK